MNESYYTWFIWYKEDDSVESFLYGKKFDDFITIPRKICSIINRINRKTLKTQFKTDM